MFNIKMPNEEFRTKKCVYEYVFNLHVFNFGCDIHIWYNFLFNENWFNIFRTIERESVYYFLHFKYINAKPTLPLEVPCNR